MKLRKLACISLLILILKIYIVLKIIIIKFKILFFVSCFVKMLFHQYYSDIKSPSNFFIKSYTFSSLGSTSSF